MHSPFYLAILSCSDRLVPLDGLELGAERN